MVIDASPPFEDLLGRMRLSPAVWTNLVDTEDERSLTVAIIGLGSMETIVTTIGIAEGIELFEFVTTEVVASVSTTSVHRLDHGRLLLIMPTVDATHVLDRIERRLTLPFRARSGHLLPIDLSIGHAEVATAPSLAEAVRRAAVASERASSSGSVRIGFRAGMDVTSPHVVMLEAELSSPEAAHELSVVVAPLVDLYGGRPGWRIALEWDHSILGVLNPREWELLWSRPACGRVLWARVHDAVTVHVEELARDRMSSRLLIPVAAHQLTNPDWLRSVVALSDDMHARHILLLLEVHGELSQHPTEIDESLSRLAAHGVSVSFTFADFVRHMPTIVQHAATTEVHHVHGDDNDGFTETAQIDALVDVIRSVDARSTLIGGGRDLARRHTFHGFVDIGREQRLPRVASRDVSPVDDATDRSAVGFGDAIPARSPRSLVER